mgnify:CR=1 FL=1
MSSIEGYKTLFGCNKKYKALIDKGFPKIEELIDFSIIYEQLHQNSEARVKLEIDLDNLDVKPKLISLEEKKK